MTSHKTAGETAAAPLQLSKYPLAEALVMAVCPEAAKADLREEFEANILRMLLVTEDHEILLSRLESQSDLYQLWMAATLVRLYVKKYGRIEFSEVVLEGIDRAMEGIREVFWGVALVRFPRSEGMTVARYGKRPCIIRTPERTPERKPEKRGEEAVLGRPGPRMVRVFAVVGGPKEQLVAKMIEEALNQERDED